MAAVSTLPPSVTPSVKVPELPAIEFDWDSEEWDRVGTMALELVTEASSNWADRRPSPVESTQEIGARVRGQLPRSGQDPETLLALLHDELLPLSTYNAHPRFFSYITSSPNPMGVIGDFVAAAFNQNVSLWRAAPLATAIELQTIDWLRQVLGLPGGAEGVFSSGGQLANVIAHNVIRDARAGWDVRKFGLRGPEGNAPRLAVYVSDQAHYCHEQAMDILGMGRQTVRSVPTDYAYRMRPDALIQMIDEDRANGVRPIAVVATAGTVGTGAVDPIADILRVARANEIWTHVDGAYGAFAILAQSAPHDLSYMGEADSIACDPHKWLYAPIGAAVTLIREPGLLEDSFQFRPPYLLQIDEPGRTDIVDRSPENTRPFRALKVWLALQAYGLDGYADMIEHNIGLGAYLEGLIQAQPDLELAAPRQLSIVCWRVAPAGVELSAEEEDSLQSRVIVELEREGAGFVSQAHLRSGRRAIRACIVNFRTKPEDLDVLVQTSARLGRELVS